MAKMTTLDGSQNIAYFTREIPSMSYYPGCPGTNLILELIINPIKAVYREYRVSLTVDSMDGLDVV